MKAFALTNGKPAEKLFPETSLGIMDLIVLLCLSDGKKHKKDTLHNLVLHERPSFPYVSFIWEAYEGKSTENSLAMDQIRWVQ